MVVVGLVRLALQVGDLLVLLLVAAIMAAGLNPLVESIRTRRWGRRRRQIPRGAAIAVVALGVAIVVGLIGSLLVTPVVSETRHFLQGTPEIFLRLRATAAGLHERYTWIPDLATVLDRLPQEAGRLGEYVGTATGAAFRVFGVVLSVITVAIFSIYMLLEGPEIKEGFLRLFDHRHHRRIESVLNDIGRKFGGWLRGQLILGMSIGVTAAVGTWLLGLPYPLLLGLAAGLTEMIPMAGPVLGAIPAVLVALFIGPPWRILATIILFTAIQQIEGNVLVPRVMKHAVGLSPLLTIVALLVGGQLLGVMGALLAVPVVAALQVIIGEALRTFREASRGAGG
jgi:predicted PurR-regulated permease PerM